VSVTVTQGFAIFVWDVITWFFSRPTLRVRIREDEPNRDVGGLVFEVENVSDKATSLLSMVTATYLTVKRRPCRIAFDVREGDRNLTPFKPRQLSASPREIQSQRLHGWFRRYSFKPSRGRVCHVRIRNANLTPVGFWRFCIEGFWFRLTGNVVSGKTSMTMDEYRAQERSKGPH